MQITELCNIEEKSRFLPLLLDADPSEEMVARYLERGRMFLLERDNPLQGRKVPEEEVLGEIVVVDLGGHRCEIMNLCVAPHARRQGNGSLLIAHAADVFSESCLEMNVGTSESGVAFYERNGFAYSHMVPRYFTINYQQPIWENGKRCEDMIYLRRSLRPSPLLSVRHTQTRSKGFRSSAGRGVDMRVR